MAPSASASRPGAAKASWSELVALSRRALLRTARQPSAWLPGVIVPLLIAAVFTGDYSRVATAIGFPSGASYLTYVLPAALLIGAIYAGIVAGTEVTIDVETGFMTRLLLSAQWRPAILAGPLLVAALQAILQGGLLLVVFWLFGSGIDAGAAGGVVILVVSVLFAIAIAAVAIALGLLAGDSEVMQSLFGLLFIGMFLSSAFFPPADMQGWYRAAARHSPFTTLADGMRDPVVGQLSGRGPVEAVAVAAICCLVGVALALGALGRLSRAAS